MKSLFVAMLLVLGVSFSAFADETVVQSQTGWGPSVVGSVGAFYFNGNYNLMNAGVFVGSAYTWDRNNNISSAGLYLGPHSAQINGVTITSIDVLAYLDLYKTASAGSFGVGLGTQLWGSGRGMNLRSDTTFLALGYKF